MLSLERQNHYRERYRAMCPGWRPSGERYEAAVRQALGHAPMRLLDLGCGAGGVVEVLGDAVPLIVGADPDWLSLRSHRDVRVRRVQSNAETLPLASGCVDVVVASWVLEHLQQPTATFREVARVLRPGGRFVVLTPNARNPITLLNRAVPAIMQSRLVRGLYGREAEDTFPVVYRANTPRTLAALAASAGLQVVAVEPVSDPTYLAFHEGLFALSVLAERFLPHDAFVHLVGSFVKPGTGA